MGVLDGGDWLLNSSIKPNVLVIIMDDIGKEQFASVFTEYDNGGLGGDSIQQPATPNITTRLLRGGMYLHRFYATPICSTTRAQMLTGRYGIRTGIGRNCGENNINPLFDSEYTLFELIRDASAGEYEIGFFGKWHLEKPNSTVSPATEVLRKGASFAIQTPIPYDDAQPYGESWYNFQADVNGVTTTVRNRYLGEYIPTMASRWINQRGSTRPWLCWVGLNLPHDPWHRPPTGTYDSGTWTLPSIGSPSVTDCLLVRPYFKAMVESMDYYIGKILDSIPPAVLAKTYIVLLGDNGTTDIPLGYNSSNPSYPAANEKFASGVPITPGRGKRSVFDPGVRVPCCIVPPTFSNPTWLEYRGIDWARDTRRDQLISVVDMAPTIANMCGIDAAAHYRRRGITVDGISVLPYLALNTDPDRDYILSQRFEYVDVPSEDATPDNNPNEPNQGDFETGLTAVIGKWGKLIRDAGANPRPDQYFCTELDPEEQYNGFTSGSFTLDPNIDGSFTDEIARIEEWLEALYASVEVWDPPTEY